MISFLLRLFSFVFILGVDIFSLCFFSLTYLFCFLFFSSLISYRHHRIHPLLHLTLQSSVDLDVEVKYFYFVSSFSLSHFLVVLPYFFLLFFFFLSSLQFLFCSFFDWVVGEVLAKTFTSYNCFTGILFVWGISLYFVPLFPSSLQGLSEHIVRLNFIISFYFFRILFFVLFPPWFSSYLFSFFFCTNLFIISFHLCYIISFLFSIMNLHLSSSVFLFSLILLAASSQVSLSWCCIVFHYVSQFHV